ncbi:MAG: 2-dehydropantoate 2-reductase [Desulfitobacteriaceae bacterium]|nr:2-dehydropantoate 2-reductase [Desulfitobacteriaceae bacterium]
MRVVVVGAGAMGCLTGGLLAQSGIDVILFDKLNERVEPICRHGLVIEGDSGCRSIKVQATTLADDLGTTDMLVVLVKSYDTREAVWGVRNCIGRETLVLTLQNGLGNIEAITGLVPEERVFAGVTSHGAMLTAPGIVRHNGGAKTHIGAVVNGGEGRVQNIARVLSAAGMETEFSPDIQGALWTKLIVNAAINPLTALSGLYNGELLDNSETLEVMRQIVNEAMQVSAREKVNLQSEDMVSHVKSICQATAGNKSSMLMDILNGRRTEIDAINGMIVQKAKEHCLATPVNETITRLVRVIERNESNRL